MLHLNLSDWADINAKSQIHLKIATQGNGSRWADRQAAWRNERTVSSIPYEIVQELEIADEGNLVIAVNHF
ncbi:hypothetical protein RRG08_045464 [Elysia crispata]|uniref:Uncharacterized protein n=1 Tax=Elysia crispata TaxID=231223 RepID=A0AAE1AWU5_9GAST|nr:hypothetical protein RRG08_045464 [Elysia crispata]